MNYFKNYIILRKVVSTLTKLKLSYVGEKLLLEKMVSNLENYRDRCVKKKLRLKEHFRKKFRYGFPPNQKHVRTPDI